MRRWPLLASVVGAALALAVLQVPSGAAAATPLTVAQAIGQQAGASATVRGYVVGQPTATNTVVTSAFPSDYAIALADAPGETSTARMIYVQVSSGFRADYGLMSNPDLMGDRLDVTGSLSAYFSHPGLKSPTAFAPAGGTTPPPDDDDYYRSALGLTGPALKAELHDIISTGARLSYDQVWDALKATDQDPANANNVILLYSGRSQSKTTNGGDANDWNREHVWAKSHGDFGTATGPGTDVHHLRPEDVSVNSARGNKDFDNGGSAVSEAPGSYTDADSFEPRNAVKGDVARMIFYMAVRYEGTDGFADLEMNNSVANGSAPYMGRLSVLLAWHAQDPPDAFEQRRNQVIYDRFQHNRNPFVDHPEWARAIWS
ncbi:endonuclease [Actinophytocola algeriensis]|uniref:Endonuclease I n=1 Tax=Actinophytocola algeriensis TaxID=1768010 RepID=A0A7W7VD76_9PSEU|nr:endonuclease [Actinophytocola algeriensis]MBB4905804.1 endonuclease I [Actinophytocola algeriensis]MBE1472511.1 endonuclease I [Actinophytocola algeriensis]